MYYFQSLTSSVFSFYPASQVYHGRVSGQGYVTRKAVHGDFARFLGGLSPVPWSFLRSRNYPSSVPPLSMETATDYFLKTCLPCFCKEGTRVIFVLPVNRSFFLSTSSHAPAKSQKGTVPASFSRGTEKSSTCLPCPTARKRALLSKIHFLTAVIFSSFTRRLKLKDFTLPGRAGGFISLKHTARKAPV